MRKALALCIALLVALTAVAQDYEKYFTPERLRIDFVFSGNATRQEVFLGGLHCENEWSGPHIGLVDKFNYGEYRISVFSGNNLIYAKGFSSLFSEWRTTADAKITDKAFNNSVWIPMPKSPVKVTISERMHEDGKFMEMNSFTIDPASLEVNREKENDYVIDTMLFNGPSESKVDIAIIAEGYTAEQMSKFRTDVTKFLGYFFSYEPYKSHKNDFNFYAVESVSAEAGTDMPGKGIWKNTVAGSGFWTFGIERYMTAQDQSKTARACSRAAFDLPLVIVNVDKYGGGGIYNYYSLCSSDNAWEGYVFTHEFSHAFAGLADEYYTSDVAYENMYDFKVEPWEPNITTKVNPDKWKDLPDAGYFEGGGYQAHGIWRSAKDCLMITKDCPGFCPACNRAINAMIDFYCER